MCFRCDTVFCSFLHCTWLCMKVRPFWHDISSTLTRITGVHVPVNPELCLLGNFTSIRRSLNSAQHKFIEIALTVTKKCIAVSWKSDSPLLIDRWSVEMNSCIPLEKNHLLSQKTIWHLFENLAAIIRPYLYISYSKYFVGIDLHTDFIAVFFFFFI